ncbi:NrdR family transcriptional regulator [Candidatus Mycosynbacter amalyticus]|uniref:NrdR family transcriptional regulator n=1 Tax=Candidatus Mycosynbacter amalyticus TaxID=2665156 RepID=UPI00406BD875
MICVYCLNKKTTIPNSRPHKKAPQVWRRRQCTSCGRVFTTYERPSLEDVALLSHSGGQVQFSPGKLIISINRALLNLPDAATTSYEFARTIELRLITRYDISSPITVSAIADETYRTLKQFDELSALQYGAQHGIIASIRRRGRPSTTATSADDVPAHE